MQCLTVSESTSRTLKVIRIDAICHHFLLVACSNKAIVDSTLLIALVCNSRRIHAGFDHWAKFGLLVCRVLSPLRNTHMTCHIGPLCKYMTSSTKPEIHNVSPRQSRFSGWRHVFTYNGPIAHHVCAIEYEKHNSRDSNQILLNDTDQQVGLLVVSCASRAKSAIYECLVQYWISFSNYLRRRRRLCF